LAYFFFPIPPKSLHPITWPSELWIPRTTCSERICNTIEDDVKGKRQLDEEGHRPEEDAVDADDPESPDARSIGLVELLRSSPLVGVELDVGRDRDSER